MEESINLSQVNPVVLMHNLTRLAFAHEYALNDLESCTYLPQREALIEVIEKSKQDYLMTRHLLEEQSPEKLEYIEKEILFQKQSVFHKVTTLQ